MSDRDGVQVRPDIQVKSTEWLLREKLIAQVKEIEYLLDVNVKANRIIVKKNEEIAALKFERRLG
jgi:hypothetical protein